MPSKKMPPRPSTPYSLADLKRDLKKRGQTLAVGQRPTKRVAIDRRAGGSQTGQQIEMTGGYFGFGVNEVSLVSTINDPVKYRGAVENHTIYNILSGNRLKNGVQREKCMIMLRADEGFPLSADGGCVDFFLQRPNTTEDKDMIRVMTLSTRGLELFVPLTGPFAPGGGGLGGIVALRSRANGKYFCGDLQFVNAPGLFNRNAVGPWEVFDLIQMTPAMAQRATARRRTSATRPAIATSQLVPRRRLPRTRR